MPQRLLVPFNASPRSLYALADLIRDDDEYEIILYYIVDLKQHDGMRRLSYVRKLSSLLRDQRGNVLAARLMTQSIQLDSRTMLAQAREKEQPHQTETWVLFQMCEQLAKQLDAWLYFPYRPAATKPTPGVRVVSVDVPPTVQDQLRGLVQKFPEIDVLTLVTCCHLRDTEFFNNVSKTLPNCCTVCTYCNIFSQYHVKVGDVRQDE